MDILLPKKDRHKTSTNAFTTAEEPRDNTRPASIPCRTTGKSNLSTPNTRKNQPWIILLYIQGTKMVSTPNKKIPYPRYPVIHPPLAVPFLYLKTPHTPLQLVDNFYPFLIIQTIHPRKSSGRPRPKSTGHRLPQIPLVNKGDFFAEAQTARV